MAAEVAGRGFDADYSANPRAVYTEPPVFCVGLTPERAQDQGLEVHRAGFDVSEVERGTLVEETTTQDGSRTVRAASSSSSTRPAAPSSAQRASVRQPTPQAG